MSWPRPPKTVESTACGRDKAVYLTSILDLMQMHTQFFSVVYLNESDIPTITMKLLKIVIICL